VVDLEYNFKAILLKNAILRHNIKGINDLVVGTCSLLVQYDNKILSFDELKKTIFRIEKAVDYNDELPSRIVEVPILFDDRWTKECALSQKLDPDFEFILSYNNLTKNEFIKNFTGTKYWVKYVGFSPGLIAFNALDQTKIISSPQLPSPRIWTPKGALGVGFSGNCIYASKTPGGIRLAGITPILTYDLKKQNIVFNENPVLFRAGDRLNLYSIDEKEFLQIRNNIHEYKYDIKESLFSLSKLKGE
jgi:allophanate hydrolase subunit 1